MTPLHRVAPMLLFACLTSCYDSVAPEPVPEDGDSALLRAGVVVSGQVAGTASDGEILAARVGSAENEIVYVSMLPGTARDALNATITNERTMASVSAIVINGGFDPVSIAALTGDVLSIVVTLSNSLSLTSDIVVPPASGSRPKIVRVNPPKGATDVPVNRHVTIVMSEPVDSNTVSAASVQLRNGTASVEGAVRVVPSSRYLVELIPAVPLERSTVYTVEMTTAVANGQGLTIETGTVSTFTTTAFTSEPLAFSEISGGLHTCALTTAGQAYCWGRNAAGQLGDGSTLNSHIPVAVSTALRFASISANASTTCALTESGAAWCWGYNGYGNFGNGTFQGSAVPVPAAPGLVFDSISVTTVATCGLARNGDAYCWGRHVYGMLGGITAACPAQGCATPIKVVGDIKFRSISTGAFTTCAQALDGTPYCWGLNSLGELGNGTTASPDACPPGFGGYVPQSLTAVPCSRTPVVVAVPEALASVKAGGFFACGLTPSGAAYCWGANNTGEHGNGTSSGFTPHPPTPTAGALRFRMLSLNNQRLCGISLEGDTYCWGANTGPGNSRFPILTAGDFAFSTIGAGASHSCGLTGEGRAYCWGSSLYGALGNGSIASSAIPVAVSPP